MRRGSPRHDVVLLYHRVAEPVHDPFALAVRPEWFAAHLEVLQSRGTTVTLDEMLDTNGGRGAVRAAVTFDDGYEDNLEIAAPLLRAAGVPATFFVCTGVLGDERGFWWDRVTSAIAATDAPPGALDGFPGIPPVDLSTADARTAATLAVAPRLRELHPSERDRLVDELEDRLPPRDGDRRERFPVMDAAALRTLAAEPDTQIGAHTHTHPLLATLPREEQRAEIARSADAIHDITGARPRFAAYPYGGEHDYNDDSCLAAGDAGMRAAFVNHADRFDPRRRPFRVPRWYVPPMDGDRFAAWLSGVLA